ncbi:MAG: thioredoxin family protein [Alphaproteobacteria bacterium]|nr:MAG: thioredoxin family protein [Alphaproteobacteria bacterium]
MRKAILHLFLVVSFLMLPTAQAASKLKLDIGDVPPSYLGKDTEGQKFEVTDHKGKVIVISFWASWCAPCRQELPVLDVVQKHIGKDRLRVVAVNFKENKRAFRQMKKQLKYMALTLTHDKRGVIGKKFGVEGIPHLLIIGKDGKVAYQAVGYGEGSVKKLINILDAQLAKAF